MDIDPGNDDRNFTLRERGSHLKSAVALKRNNAPRPVDRGRSRSRRVSQTSSFNRKAVRFVTVRAPEPKLGGLNFRESVSIRTDPAVDLATGPRATKGEALHGGLRESSPPEPDGPARLVNNYLSAAAHERAAQAVLFCRHGANPLGIST